MRMLGLVNSQFQSQRVLSWILEVLVAVRPGLLSIWQQETLRSLLSREVRYTQSPHLLKALGGIASI